MPVECVRPLSKKALGGGKGAEDTLHTSLTDSGKRSDTLISF